MTVVQLSLPGDVIHVSGEGLDLEGEFSRDGETVDPQEDTQLETVLRTGVLCNNAALPDLDEADNDMEAVGDPLEVALLVAGAKAGMRRPELLESMPELREVAFETDTKMMATFHETDDGKYIVAVKGALGAVLDACDQVRTSDGKEPLNDDDRDDWLERNNELAAEGLRIIAMATKTVDDPEVDPYENLTFLGLTALLDPPREEVSDAIAACHQAGIGVVMVTGDQPETARKVAYAVDLVSDEEARAVYGQDLEDVSQLDDEERQKILNTPIFARVTPKQKLDLIAAHQDAGAIVAMTGDGVNDAPALKKADIGVAMGIRGTQVAKEAADMILKDDAFGTIVAAVEQGRAIFENIRKFVLYLLSCNVAEILVVGMASVVNAPLPIKPLQILFLNLVTDVFPALALGVGEGDEYLMHRPPRDPEESILTRKHWTEIFGFSMLITLAVLAALAIALTQFGMQQQRAITLSFLTLAFAQLWHVFNMRDPDAGLIRNDITQNPYVWGALVLSVGMLLLVIYVPFLANLLQLSRPGLSGWLLVLGLSLLPLIIGQVVQEVRKAVGSER
jgi:Ca2+-transporting ATPase